jgi:aminopeptidase N
VTCRDWFQLTLKEGLTVYRDSEFTADMNSRAVKRLEDVVRMRAAQFAEDASPMAHPIRPDSYIKMDNFYTLYVSTMKARAFFNHIWYFDKFVLNNSIFHHRTVYEKGAEVIRLYEQVLGKDGFRKGMDLYFKRHDGQAVTCDDFLAAMADANNEDLSALAKWYSQSGTPSLDVEVVHDAAAGTLTLNCKQSLAPTVRQPETVPVLIPIRMGLLGADGRPLTLNGPAAGKNQGAHEVVLRMTELEQSFVFEGVGAARPVPSLLRGFSAPVKMTVKDQTDADLMFLLQHDTDTFNRYEAGQVLAKQLLLSLYKSAAASADGSVVDRLKAAGGVSPQLMDAYRALLADSQLDGQFKAYAISLPADTELIAAIAPNADPVLLFQVRAFVIESLAVALRAELEHAVAENDDPADKPFEFSAPACARRALKNKALGYLATLQDESITKQLLGRFHSAANMTDEMAALAALDLATATLSGATPASLAARQEALDAFYQKWQAYPLVLLKWLTVQAVSNAPNNVAAVAKLVEHSSFSITNPNCCYSLFLAFARSAVNFHAADGSGYAFMADTVLKVDQVNHQVASRVVSAFTNWRQFDAARGDMMRTQLKRIADTPGVSENVFEIASKSLN